MCHDCKYGKRDGPRKRLAEIVGCYESGAGGCSFWLGMGQGPIPDVAFLIHGLEGVEIGVDVASQV